MSGSRFFGKKKDTSKDSTNEAKQPNDSNLSEATSQSETTEDEVTNQTTTQSSLILHKAYNTYLDKKSGKYMLVTVEYNPELLTSKVLSVEPFTGELTVALHKLQGMFALKVFRNEESV